MELLFYIIIIFSFCKRQGPDVNFPVLAKNDIKMWYVAERNYTGSFMCEVLKITFIEHKIDYMAEALISI